MPNQKELAAAIKKFNKQNKTPTKCGCNNGKIGGKTCIACGGTGYRN